jgi:hypothetical protein
MVIRSILLCLVLSLETQAQSLAHCISSVGLPSSSEGPWRARLTLTIARDRYASRISFDEDGRDHATYLVFSVLRTLRFKGVCAGQRITFTVTWEPAKEPWRTVQVREGELILRSHVLLPAPTPQGRVGGVLAISQTDLDHLARVESMQDFFKARGLPNVEQ